MSVYKRGNVYWFDFWRHGERYIESTGHTNKQKAKDVERKAMEAVADGVYEIKRRNKVPTFSEFVPRVMARVKLEHADKPRSVSFYQQTYNKIITVAILADAKLNHIDEALLTDFSIQTKAKGLMPATVNRRLACVRKALYIAKKEKMIRDVPEFTMLKGERRREFVLAGDLREKFISGLPETTQPIARFLCDVPLRITECCKLKWDRVFVVRVGDEERILIQVKEGKSAKAARFLPLTKDAQAIIKAQRDISRSDYVFVRYGPRVEKVLQFVAPVSRHTISQQFTDRRKELGLPWDCVLHSTRHTALTDLGAAGAGVFTLMGAAGHSTVEMTERYVHPLSEEMLRAFDRMSDYRSANGGTKVVPSDFTTFKESE